MRPFLQMSSLAVLLVGSALATAQDQAPAPPSSAASMPMDCAAVSPKRHDHGAERNAPTPAASSCASKTAAGSAAKPKPRPIHDHAKFHKNQ